MTAAEARARKLAHDVGAAAEYERMGAREYRDCRLQADIEIGVRSAVGYSSAIVPRPGHPVAAELFELRLRRKGFEVRWMTHAPVFQISWSEQ